MNILFCIADDASHFGCYGHEFVNTPSIDSLAENGMKLNRMYTSNPKCAPSRASLLTGMHTWQLEEACNHFGLFNSKFSVYPDLLEEAGYHVGFTGKGWSPGDFLAGGFTRNPAGPVYNNFKMLPPEGSNIAVNDYTKNFESFLEEKEIDQPFCFWFGCHEPHRPYNFGENRKSDQLERVKVPPFLPDTPEVRQDFIDYAFEIEWFDKHVGQMVKILEEKGLLEDTLILVTSDNGMPFPRVKGQMYENDFNLPCIVYHKNEIKPGTESDALVSFTDIGPTFLDGAGLKSHPQMVGKSLLPLFRQEEDYLENEVVYMAKERHDLGRLDDKAYPVRVIRDKDYLYIMNLKPELWPSGNPETGFTNCDSSVTKDEVLRRHQEGYSYYFDLCFGKRPYEELYFIEDDPYCMQNLANQESLSDQKNKLKNQLVKALLETQDPRMTGQGDCFDTYAYIGADNHSYKAYTEGRYSKQKF